MLFSELYSAYYNAVAAILRKAVNHPVSKEEILQIVQQEAFEESSLHLIPALSDMRWPLLQEDGTSTLNKQPSMPLTTLQKRWLKAMLNDPRIQLFESTPMELNDTEPLFTAKDYTVFDQYNDGDPYLDPNYIKNFRIIHTAIKDKQPLQIQTQTRTDKLTTQILLPLELEYSEKDDKFRVNCAGAHYLHTINLARICTVKPYTGKCTYKPIAHVEKKRRTVVFDVYDERKAMERVLLHFAHYEKRAECLTKDKYRVTLQYDEEDETEIVIRILSFGPMVKVLEPTAFVDLIKDRLKRQRSCEQK